MPKNRAFPLLVAGDIILDCYLRGTASRLSPEAPVPVIQVHDKDRTYSLGGAANVAANIVALGGDAVLLGITGKDSDADILEALLAAAGIKSTSVYRSSARRTTVKTRILANGAQIARLDAEDAPSMSHEDRLALRSIARRESSHVSGVVISDYAKGVVTPEFMNVIYTGSVACNYPVFIDPKVRNNGSYKPPYSLATSVITPNYLEAVGLYGSEPEFLEELGTGLLKQLGVSHVLITMGDKGMALFTAISGEPQMFTLPTTAKTVFDVSGAGDTVIATIALGKSRGMTILESAQLANLAAGIVVGKAGTATVSKEELLQAALDSCIIPLYAGTR